MLIRVVAPCSDSRGSVGLSHDLLKTSNDISNADEHFCLGRKPCHEHYSLFVVWDNLGWIYHIVQGPCVLPSQIGMESSLLDRLSNHVSRDSPVMLDKVARSCWIKLLNIDGLLQESRNFIANALELRGFFFSTNPSICHLLPQELL